MIVKIQRPLMTNGDTPQALIYNKSKKVQVMQDLGTVEELFKDGEMKIYHYATINADKMLVIKGRAPYQSW